MDVFQESCERDLKAIKLRMRQDRLKSLLFEEAKQYEVKFHCSSVVVVVVELMLNVLRCHLTH